MKHTHLFLLFVTTLFISCGQGGYNEPVYPGGGGTTPGGGSGGSTPTVQPTKAQFSYTILQPLSVVIEDNSTGDKVDYDFGDNTKKQIKPGNEITHKYTKAGTYVIKAVARNSKNETSEIHKSVTINKPEVYVAGLKYKKIDYDDRYYKFKLNDDGPWVVKTWVNSSWSDMLYSAILPYTFKFKTPVLLEHPEKYTVYTLYVYQNNKSSGDGTQCLKQDISVSDITAYPESLEVSNNSGKTVVDLMFEYK